MVIELDKLEQDNNIENIQEKREIEKYEKAINPIYQVVFLGILTILTIIATAILHSNEQEFIIDRFTGLSSLQVSLYDTILYIAYFIFGLITGILSDKLAKRKIFVFLGSLGAALFFFLMTLTNNYYVLLVFRFLQGTFTVMAWQVLMTIVLDLSSSEKRGKHMGIFGIFLASAMGLGPILGGFLATVGVFIPYYVASGLTILAGFLALIAKEPIDKKQKATLRESFLVVKKHPRLLIPSLFNFIDRLHMGFIIFALPLLIGYEISEGGLGLDPELRGMALGLFAVPFILLQYPIGRLSDKIGRYLPLIIGSCCYGIVLCLVGYLGTLKFSILLILLITLGLFSGVTSSPSMALVGDSISNENYGSGMGFFNLLGNIGIAVGPIIAGLLIPYGFGLAFLIAGILELVSLGINILLIFFVFKEDVIS